MCLAIHSDAQSKCVSVYINFSNWQSILLSLYVRTWWIEKNPVKLHPSENMPISYCHDIPISIWVIIKNAINFTNFKFKCSLLWAELCKNLLVKKQSANLRSLRGQMFWPPPPIQLPWAPTQTQTLTELLPATLTRSEDDAFVVVSLSMMTMKNVIVPVLMMIL